jgi:hypothetical protein
LTTILADLRSGVMVADTNFSDGESRGQMRKVWRINGQLVGLAGNLEEMPPFILWMKDGMEMPGPKIPNLYALVMGKHGLLLYNGSTAPVVVQSKHEAIGTGGVAAKAAFEAMDFTNPRRAVLIACNHDNGSRPPVRVYRLNTKETT